MSIDLELFFEYKEALADKYTAEELCELLGLDVWDLLEADTLQDKILDHQSR